MNTSITTNPTELDERIQKFILRKASELGLGSKFEDEFKIIRIENSQGEDLTGVL